MHSRQKKWPLKLKLTLRWLYPDDHTLGTGGVGGLVLVLLLVRVLVLLIVVLILYYYLIVLLPQGGCIKNHWVGGWTDCGRSWRPRNSPPSSRLGMRRFAESQVLNPCHENLAIIEVDLETAPMFHVYLYFRLKASFWTSRAVIFYRLQRTSSSRCPWLI